MPTRLYFSSTVVAEVNPAFGGWGESSEAVRRKILSAKDATESLALGTRIGWAAGQTQLDRQYVSRPMNSGISFSAATVKLQLAAREFNNGDNSTSRLLVKIVSEDGNTLRQTLLALGQFGPATELINNATLRNKIFADGDTVAGTYTTVAGDRIVVEIGYADATGTTPEGQARYGAPTGTADHGENETETTSLVPWVEFSNTITFQATQVTKTFTSDVIVKDTDVTKIFTADLLVKQEQTKTLTADLIVKALDTQKTFTSDLLTKQLDIQKTFSSDLLVRIQGTKDFTADLITEEVAPPPAPAEEPSLGGGERRITREPILEIIEHSLTFFLKFIVIPKKEKQIKKEAQIIYPRIKKPRIIRTGQIENTMDIELCETREMTNEIDTESDKP